MATSNSKLNIRQRINALNNDSDDVVLYKNGVISPEGNLTDLGRRVQADLVFGGKTGSKADIVEAVKAAVAADEQ